jgi:thymidylate kinase
MYIALEGIKGSGKSTLITQIQYLLQQSQIKYSMCAYTSAADPSAASEQKALLYANKIMPDELQQWVYYNRALKAVKTTNWRDHLVLGDRSIYTTLVTRMPGEQAQVPHYLSTTLEKYAFVPIPNHVLLLEVPIETAIKRIQARPQRSYGQKDETPERLYQARQAYHHFIEVTYAQLQNTQIHVIDATKPGHVVVKEAANVLTGILQKPLR